MSSGIIARLGSVKTIAAIFYSTNIFCHSLLDNFFSGPPSISAMANLKCFILILVADSRAAIKARKKQWHRCQDVRLNYLRAYLQTGRLKEDKKWDSNLLSGIGWRRRCRWACARQVFGPGYSCWELFWERPVGHGRWRHGPKGEKDVYNKEKITQLLMRETSSQTTPLSVGTVARCCNPSRG